jgi:hypothetical protein
MYDGRLFKDIPLQKPHTTNPFDNNKGISSGVNTTKGARAYSPADFSTWQVFAHETNHCLGAIDDYLYEGGDYYATGWSSSSMPCGRWGIMGDTTSMCSNATPDPTIWYKFRNGWLNDDQVVSVIPGESKTFKIAASGAKDAELAAAGITDAVKMVLLPTDLRTIDVLWPDRMTNNRAVHANGTIFAYLEYFMPLFLHAFAPDVEYVTGTNGITHPSRRVTFPTAYTLECRRAVGADYKNTAATAGNKGVLINQLSNITWETGCGAAGQKTVRVPSNATNANTSCIGLAPYSNNSSWSDNNRGITVKVIESTALYDVVEITYAPNSRPYIGELKINNDITANVSGGQTFTLPLDLRTIGEDLTNGTPNPAVVAGRTGSPLGVPEGIATLSATITFDPTVLEYVGLDKAFETVVVNDSEAGKLVIDATNPKMLKGVILGLQFEAKTSAPAGLTLTNVGVAFDTVGLLDFRGNSVPISGIRLTTKGGAVEIFNILYTVTFLDHDGTVLDTQQVVPGSTALAPAEPTREGYTFIGWDVDFSDITDDLTVNALYEINVYTVSFYKQSQDGNNGIAKTPYATHQVTYNELIDWTKISAGKNAVWYITDGKTFGAKFDPLTPITGDVKLAVKDQNNQQ